MRFRNKKGFNLNRIFIPLIIVPTIFFILLATGVYFLSRSQLHKTGQISVEKFSAQASSILNELKLVNDSLLNNQHFYQLICKDTLSSEEDQLVVLDIASQLSRSAYVQEAYVISRGKDAIYTSKARYGYEISLYTLLNSDKNSPVFGPGENEDDLNEGWSDTDNMHSVPYYVSHIYDRSGTKQATMVLFLNIGYLYRSLFITDSAFSCIYSNDFLISSDLTQYPGIDYTSKKDIEKLTGKRVELFSYEENGYTYLLAMEKGDFYKPLYLIIASCVAYLILVLAFSAALIIRTKKKEKAFFSNLIAELPQHEGNDPLLDNNVFAAIQTALNNYKEEHQSFADQQKFQNLERFVSGFLDESAVKEITSPEILDPQASEYYCMTLSISEEGILNPVLRNDLICVIVETTMNSFSEGKDRAVCFPKGAHDLCVILNVFSKDVDFEYLHELFNHTHRLLEKDYGTLIKCAVSHPVNTIEQIPDAYQESTELASFIRVINSRALFISGYQMDESYGILLKGDFLKQLQVLSSTLLIGKYDLIPTMVDTIIEQHITPMVKNFGLVNHRLVCVTTLLLETPLPDNISDEDETAFREALKNINSVSELSEQTHICFEKLIENTDNKGSSVEKACEFISEQIGNEQLSVPMIAEYSGVSVQHLSRLFKAEKNMTMVEYINQFRVSRAKELLVSSELTVTEIAEQTGYYNNGTFIRNFKKYVGCTPSEYRSGAK